MPINYSSYFNEVKSPLDKALASYRTGTAIRQDQERQELMQVKRGEIEQQKEQFKLMQYDLNELSGNPNAGPREYAQMILKYPSLSEHLKRASEVMSEEEKGNGIKSALSVFSALEVGDNDAAISILTEEKEAAEEAGLTDQVSGANAMLQMVKMRPEAAKTAAALSLSVMLGEDKFATNYSKLKDEHRKQALQPEKIKKAELSLEAMEKGEIPKDPEKLFKAENDLRKEYAAVNADYLELQGSIEKMRTAASDGPGDIALITGFMKMLDPGSVVRESEYAIAVRASGAVETARAWLPRLAKGDQLSDQTRAKFKAQAERVFKAAGVKEKGIRTKLQTIATRYGLNADNIFYTVSETEGNQDLSKFTDQVQPGTEQQPAPVTEEREVPAEIKKLLGI